MPKFAVSKSILIKASKEKCFSIVRDFTNWPIWSPWLIVEPECKLSFSDDGNSYSWDGKLVGAGEIKVENAEQDRSISYFLTFLKPWKSESKVSFRFTESGEGTEVNWGMDGSLPFFMFWMKGMMTTFIGMDYDRGLSMLKDYVETGSVPSKLEYLGTQTHAATRYVGVRTECAIDKIGSSMEVSFKKLCKQIEGASIEKAGVPFSIYHKWEITKGLAEYTVGFPVADLPTELPSGLVSGEAPNCTTYSIKHTGPYRHLGNAWSAGMTCGRSKVFKQNKKIPPFETYESDPEEVPENELVTVIHFPVK